jgi:ABC-2 type transport system ATP-binding protein
MLVGLARPDSGRIRIFGSDLSGHFVEAMKHVGSIVESPDLYRYLSGRENLLHFSRMLPDGAATRIEELARLVNLEGRLDDKVSSYSLGMRQRLGIAQALLGNPDLLILDEPANGLDPAGIREIRHLIRSLAHERGLAVFVSSHLLAEVEQMCDRVAIIHRGRTLAAGSVQDLLERSTAGRTRFIVGSPEAAGGVLARQNGVTEVLVEGRDAVTAHVSREAAPAAIAALVAAGVALFAVERPSSTLEEVFLEVTGGETV